ncbi:hypothetical protein DM02DRAFT_547740 [Periconia macrospinosa]|uniref:Secreted protein n=1 Tax=Periconia macrospinosa TaxID=97972 RepID=A0A2V1CXJ1_9PLEO|nr:hypothetical protein DM02DRAFT_547740 [Periconia macrospinosa]
MSTCLSLVWSLSISFVTTPTVCLLSHSRDGVSFNLNDSPSNNRNHSFISEPARDKESNSASVVDLVTVRWTVAFQSMAMPNRVNTYPCELRRVSGSSANAASDAP